MTHNLTERYWQRVSEQDYREFNYLVPKTVETRKRQIVGDPLNGYEYEALISEQELEEFYDWATACDEAHNNPRM